MLPFSSKIAVYEWFQQMQGWNRMDFICSLLNLCNPFELRFIGSCVEDLAQTDYNSLRDQEIKANSSENLEQHVDKSPPDEFRSQIIVCLALLQSSNYKVASKLARILEEQLRILDLENLMTTGQDAVIEEWMLMLTLASYHPAFRFEEKLNFKTKLTEYERLNKRERKGARYPRAHNRVSQPHQAASKYNVSGMCEWGSEDSAVIPPQYPAYPVGYTQAYLIAYPPQQVDNTKMVAHTYVPRNVLDTTPQVFPALPNGIGDKTSMVSQDIKNQSGNQVMGDRSVGINTSSGERTIMSPPSPWILPSTSWTNLSNKPIYVCSSTSPQTTVLPVITQNLCFSNSAPEPVSGPVPSVPLAGLATQSHGNRETVSSTTSCQYSGKTPTICNHHRPQDTNLQGGDVTNQPPPIKVPNCYAAQNFKYGDNTATCEAGFAQKTIHPKNTANPSNIGQVSSTMTTTGLGERMSQVPPRSLLSTSKSLDSASCMYNHEQKTSNVGPVDVSVKLVQVSEKDDPPSKKGIRFVLTVKWSDSKTSECSKTVDEMIKFYKEMSCKLRASCNTDFLTKQNNQIYERGQKLEYFFREVLASPLDSTSQRKLSSFLEYPNNSGYTLSSLSLPFKKRKLKGQRSHVRQGNNSSSSSTASPPLLNTSQSRILSPTSNRPVLSLSPSSADNNVSTSSVTSSPASSNRDMLTSPLSRTADAASDDGNPQNDPYFKLYYWLKPRQLVHLYTYLKSFNFEEFCNMKPGQIDDLHGPSPAEKSILRREVAKLAAQKAGMSSSLEIDLGMLAITSSKDSLQHGGARVADIRTILDDAIKPRSDDEKSSESNSVPAAVELPDDAGDSLQAVASNSCFSFEFDSSSATVDSSARSSGPPSQKNSEIELETSYLSVAASVGLEMPDPPRCPSDTSSGVEFVDPPRYQSAPRRNHSQPEFPSQAEFGYSTVPPYAPTSSRSTPSLKPMSYYKPLHSDDVVLGPSVMLQGQPTFYQHVPMQFRNTTAQSSNPNATLTSPTFVCAPLFQTAGFTTMPSPALSVGSQKPVLLTYTPTSTTGNIQDVPGTIYTTPSPVVPVYSMTPPIGGVPQHKFEPANTMTFPTGYYQTPEQKREDATVIQQPALAQGPIIYATSYGTCRPAAPFPTMPPMNSENTTVQQSYRDSETDDHISPLSSDPDISPRVPESAGPPGTTTVLVPDARYFTPSTPVSSSQSFLHSNSALCTMPPSTLYRLPNQQDSQWPPITHVPLGSSYSDPTHYTPIKNNHMRTDYMGNYPGPASGSYYVTNGYPEPRGMYSRGPGHNLNMPMHKPSQRARCGKKDNRPPRKTSPFCCNCGKRGHTNVDCKDPPASEVTPSDFHLRMSQPGNSRRGND